MNMLQFAYPEDLSSEADEIRFRIQSVHSLNRISKALLDEDSLILLVFGIDAKKKNYLEEFPWLKEQLERSSIKRFKVMPILVYHSASSDPESLFDGELGNFYESIFSGEFKPYGWDLDSDSPEKEFERVLEQYLE